MKENLFLFMGSDDNSAESSSGTESERDAKILIQNVDQRMATELKNRILECGIREKAVKCKGDKYDL